MTRDRAESLATLLRCQDYLDTVEWATEPVGLNMDAWRGRYNNRLNLADMMADTFGMGHSPRLDPWLVVDPNKIARVVFHRSPRYQNWNFTEVWKRAWEKYRYDTVFVGSYEEHRDFCTYVGPIARYQTRDYLELARVIEGCDLFVGNQSSPFWLAEGLKKSLILEVCLNCQNCHFERPGFIYGINEGTDLPTF